MTLHASTYTSVKKAAYKAHKSGRYQEAIKKTKEYIKAHPKSIKAKNLLAVLYFWSKDYKRAKEELDNILAKSDYSESKKLLRLVDKKLRKISKQTDRRKRYTLWKADKDLLPSKDTPKTASNLKSMKNSSISDKSEIVRENSSHLVIEPKILDKKSSDLFAKVALQNKKSDIDDFDRLAALIDLDGDDLKSKETLSKYYLQIGNYQKAYDFAREVVELDPSNDDMQKIVLHLSKRDDVNRSKVYLKRKIVDLQKAKERLSELFKDKKYTQYLNLYKALQSSGERLGAKENENALFCAVHMGDFSYAKRILAYDPLPHSRYKRELQSLLDEK
jgi:tetratricopeptide (TPR) repeat protein